MRPEDDYPEERDPGRHPRFELFYHERVGNRYQLRMTYFAVAIVAVLTLIPIVAILAFYFYQKKATPARPTDTNIRLDTATPTPYRFDPGPVPTVRLPPVPTPQLRAEDLKALPPTPAATPDDAVEQPTRRPTPRPTRPSTPPPAPSSSPPPSPTPP